MADVFDLCIVGGGPAGYTGAIRARQLGLTVACVEKRKTLGGTCLNTGCIPSKALLDSSEHFYFAKNKMAKHGILTESVRLDLGAMMKRKDGVVKSLTQGIAGLFKKNGVTHIEGAAKLLKPQGGVFNVQVTLGAGGTQVVQARRLLLATGSEPIELPFLKFDQKRVLSSTEVLSLEVLPKDLIVVGGGYIGLEMASVWSRLGTKVTVVEYLSDLLPMSDQQVARELFKALTKQGIEFKLGTKCLGSKVDASGVTLDVEQGGQKSQLRAEYVLVCTGRRPFTDNLGLEDVGVQKDDKGRVLIDTHFETNIKGIWAVGDIVDGPMLAHKAEEEAVAAVEIMSGRAGHVNYEVIPSVIYTWPELASVGRTEEELKSEARAYKVGTFPLLANARAKAMDESEGLVKVLADAQTDTVLGVHIFAPRASDMIAEAAAVMEFGGSSEDIARTCHGHPTLSEALKEAALAVEKRQINF
jgi:dihydrolipoamide dehydrogenase